MNNQGSKNQSNQNLSVQSFLESLRRQPSHDQGPEDAPFSPFERFQEKKRLEEERKNEFFQSRTREFKEVYSLKKRQEENKINQLHQELKRLAKSMRKLKREVDVALTQSIPEETQGQQQETFLDHIKSMLDLFKRQVDSAQTWLHLYNQRSRKKAFYWGQVQKQGTSYMNSGERTIATSVG